MTKKELSQLAALNREVAMYDKQIERLQTQINAERTSDTVHGSSPAFPFVLHSISLNGISDNVTTRKLQAKLSIAIGQAMLARERCVDEYNRLMGEIAKERDSITRQVLTYRYINGLTWPQVAAHIGGGMTPDGARMIANRHFDKSL
ncbi:RNA polymerase subunit sigma-24 [Allofournierella sp.]|uniref:RNA polymerase subunit sigma-24 n=1 Tax=Allofournierella sp. TaxID=1940256 RepID=UPI003AF0ADEC